MFGTFRRSTLPHFGRGLPALALLVALTGCKSEQVDPVQQALVAYEQPIEPILHKQEDISKLFVAITLDKNDADAAVARLGSEGVPLSQKVVEELQGFQISEPTLAALHQTLIEAATLRVEGYKMMVQGYQDKNLDMFAQGRQKVTDSKIREDTYISQINQLSARYGIKIDFYPPTQ